MLADEGSNMRKRFWEANISIFRNNKNRGWESFCAHIKPGFYDLAREFDANMVGMREDTVFVRRV